MTAQVFFETGSAENVLIVPISALKFATAADGAGARVVEIVLPDGTTEARTIVVGAIDGANAEVISGLDEGERVIARRTRS
jgi:macrolide-specific efflux system membrane fusion protein